MRVQRHYRERAAISHLLKAGAVQWRTVDRQYRKWNEKSWREGNAGVEVTTARSYRTSTRIAGLALSSAVSEMTPLHPDDREIVVVQVVQVRVLAARQTTAIWSSIRASNGSRVLGCSPSPSIAVCRSTLNRTRQLSITSSDPNGGLVACIAIFKFEHFAS